MNQTKIIDGGAGDVAVEIIKRYRVALLDIYLGSKFPADVAKEALGKMIPVIQSREVILVRIANVIGYKKAARRFTGANENSQREIILPPHYINKDADSFAIVATRPLELKDVKDQEFAKMVPDWTGNAKELIRIMIKKGKFSSRYESSLGYFEVSFDDKLIIRHQNVDWAVCMLFLRVFGGNNDNTNQQLEEIK